MQSLNCRNIFRNEKYNVWVVSLAAAAVILPMLFWGTPDGVDISHHYQCAATYLESFAAGEFYPSWSAERNFGYGGLEARLYPPLSHITLALFRLAAGNWHLATWATFTFWWIVGSLGVYIWAREFVEPKKAVCAAVLFALIPYRINEVYQTFMHAELVGGAILPFCFAFLTRILKSSDEVENLAESLSLRRFLSGDVIGLAISFAALILAHLPLTFIGGISLGIYFLTQVEWKFYRFLQGFLKTSLAVGLALAATSFFWTKVLQEHFLMAKNSFYDTIFLRYENNFLLTHLQTYDEVNVGVSYITAYYDVILLLTVLAFLPLAIIGWKQSNAFDGRKWRGVRAIFIFSILVGTIFSKPLWDYLPLFSEVQFPWRWLNIVSVAAPILAVSGFSACSVWLQNEKLRAYSVTLHGLMLISLGGMFFFVLSTAKYIPPPEMEGTVEKFVRQEGFEFWWTTWAKKEFLKDSLEKVSAANRNTEIIEWKNSRRKFIIKAGEATDARVAVFYHPNWEAVVNNKIEALKPDPNGALLVTVSTEDSSINLEFRETRTVIFARYISLLCWILLFLYWSASPLLGRLKTFRIKN